MADLDLRKHLQRLAVNDGRRVTFTSGSSEHDAHCDTYSALVRKLRFYVSWNLAAHNTGANTIAKNVTRCGHRAIGAMCLALSTPLGCGIFEDSCFCGYGVPECNGYLPILIRIGESLTLQYSI